MLLYIFWHWPRPEADSAVIRRRRSRVPRARCALASPDGLLDSAVHRLTGAPWANAGASAYEDLYLLQDSAALDVLNEAAVRAPGKHAHDRLAHAMLAGTAGLYGYALGAPSSAPIGTSHWFRKPPGFTYPALYGSLAEGVRDGCSLWRRQMVLSPAPEFCAFGFDPAATLPELETAAVQRTLCWPAAQWGAR